MGDIIDDIIKREGSATNDPLDPGGQTQFGISRRSNPEAWKDGVVTYQEARRIYEKKYILPFKGLESYIYFEQLVDWGVTSGPSLVIIKLQQIVGAEEDGILGPHSLALIGTFDEIDLNNKIVKEHVKMIGRIVVKNPSQLKYLNGWLNRALEFLI